MSPEQQIKALTELDGVPEPHIPGSDEIASGSYYQFEPLYLDSYDAIIPLRIKACNTPAVKVGWLNHARSIVARRIGKLVSDFDIASILPHEDCEALIRATGKWIE